MLLYDIGSAGPSGGRLPSPFNNRCHLSLFGEVGNKDRSVLVVSMQVQFRFRKTIDEFGLPYAWTSGEKATFVRDATLAIKGVWDDRFRIVTTSTVPEKAFRDVGVLFNLSILIDGLSIGEDYEFKVKKVSPFDDTRSYVQNADRTGELNNQGTTPQLKLITKTKLSIYQLPVAHEFGHMLGLRDEYPEANAPNPNWTTDLKSILHSGGDVRPRHYVPFATWLTQKFARQSRRADLTTTFKVDGRHMGMFDETNAKL